MSLLLGTILYLTATSQIAEFSASISSATLSNGNYVLAWTFQNGNVAAQIFNSEGLAQGSIINVEQGEDVTFPPAVAGLQNGTFIITWVTLQLNQQTLYNIYARLYNLNGGPEGQNFEVNKGNLESPAQGPRITAAGNAWMITLCSQQVICDWFLGSNGELTIGYQRSKIQSKWLTSSVCSWSDGTFLVFQYSNNENMEATIINSGSNHESFFIESYPGYNFTKFHLYTSVSCLTDSTFLVLYGYPYQLFGMRYYQNGSVAGNSMLFTDNSNYELLGFNSEVLLSGSYIISYMNSEGTYISIYNNENIEVAVNVEISNQFSNNEGMSPIGIATSSKNNSFSVSILSNNYIQLSTFNQFECTSGQLNSCPEPYFCNEANKECVECFSNHECGLSPMLFCHNSFCSICTSNSDCATNSSFPFCGSNGLCVRCNQSEDCPNVPFLACNQETFTCVVCVGNSECASNTTGQYCDVFQSECVECLDNTECGGKPICSLGTCMPCTNNEECPNNEESCCDGGVCCIESSGVIGLVIILFFAKKYFTKLPQKEGLMEPQTEKDEKVITNTELTLKLDQSVL